ncbi:hypothetical protein BS78_05G053500 [Paspalum vaginatum]|nr:hypothetical protein BS78_05G053500 [Paspalum vaginatum]KAJ1274324.1 hypothetical protein BS78_05G053500 [Paspalum vaginatum]
MEPAAWVPSNFQPVNWGMEPAAWSPGFPAESETESIEMYGSWIQSCIPNYSCGGQPLVEYYDPAAAAAAAAATQHYPLEKEAQDQSVEVVLYNMEMHCPNVSELQKVMNEFETDIDMIKEKMHRYPESIRDLGDQYTVPRTVAIGPYHHNRQQLKKAEQVKRVAAYHCIIESGRSELELYHEVASAANDVRRLYDKDVMQEEKADPWLRSFFYSNSDGIHHDVWLLENQLPWKVVKSVMKFSPVELDRFVDAWRDRLHDRKDLKGKPHFAWDDNYEPRHLLGLLRHYIVGRSRQNSRETDKDAADKLKSLSFSVGAIELAEMGITLRANETAELADMGLNNGIFFAELSLAPLSLNYARASRLVNMAALEMCYLTPTSVVTNIKDSAVCSYLVLLSMLVHREEDVHELRRKGILQGGSGLTNKQVIDLFPCFQSLPNGLCSTLTMQEIERYRMNRKSLIEGHAFWYRNKKSICTVFTTIVSVVSIVGTLIAILTKVKPLKAAP